MNRFNTKLLILACLLLPAATVFAQEQTAEEKRMEAASRYFAEGSVDKAIAEYDAVIRFNPRNNNAFGMRGNARMLKGDTDGAIADYETAIKLSPNALGIEKAYNNLGIAHQFKGDHITAFNMFDKAVKINPGYASPYNGRGVIFERRGLLKLALADFNKALELNPALTPAYSGRAGVRFQNGEFDLALADYEKAIELDPDGASIRLNRGIIRGIQNKWELAVDDMKDAFALQGRADPLFGGSLSVAFFDLDKYLVGHPKNARAYAARGFIGLLRGRDGDAEKDFARSFLLEPVLKRVLAELIAHVKVIRTR